MATAPASIFLPRSPWARAVAGICLLISLGLVGFGLWQAFAPQATPLIGGAFSLTDQFGKTRTDADFRGQFLLVFFGFTHCPDICPVELQTLSDVMDQLGAGGAKVTPLFITVDPARDTPDVMKQYVANFHPRIVALTGSVADVAAVAKAYRVYYARVTGGTASNNDADYIMNHSAIVYLMGPDGHFVSHFDPGTSAARMVDALRKLL
jgi:cytochrome oxidase Cu insertion factor (SCO1/SenC/PrrC family)